MQKKRGVIRLCLLENHVMIRHLIRRITPRVRMNQVPV